MIDQGIAEVASGGMVRGCPGQLAAAKKIARDIRLVPDGSGTESAGGDGTVKRDEYRETQPGAVDFTNLEARRLSTPRVVAGG